MMILRHLLTGAFFGMIYVSMDLGRHEINKVRLSHWI